MAVSTIPRSNKSEILYDTITDVSSDTTIDIPRNPINFSYLQVTMNVSSGNPSSTRFAVVIPTASANGYWIPACSNAINGAIRIGLTTSNLRFIDKTGFSELYLINVMGIV